MLGGGKAAGSNRSVLSLTYQVARQKTSASCALTALALAWGVAAAYYLFLRNTGPSGDEGSYCTIGQGIINGYLPYRDYFNEKPPLQFYWTALIFSLFGSGIESSRIASSIMLGLALSLSLYQLAARSRSITQLAFWASVLAVVGVVMRAYNNLAESTLALLFVASLLLTIKPEALAARPASFLTGFLQGVACGFRQTALVSALMLLAAPWHRTSRWVYVSGLLSGLTLWIGLISSVGIFRDAIEAIVLFHVDNPARSTYFNLIESSSVKGLALWALVLAGVAIHAYRTQRNWITAWLIIAALPFFGRMDAFKLWPSMLMGFTYLFTYANIGPHRRTLLPYLLALLITLLSISRPSSFEKDEAISKQVMQLSSSNDTIWVGPFMPNIYCMSNRRPASRYYFALPWTIKQSAKMQLIKDLYLNRPKVIVDVSNKWFSLNTLTPEIMQLIKDNYILVKDSGTARLYLRKSQEANQNTPIGEKHV